LTIFVDNRERKSIVPSQLEKMGDKIEFTNLEVGDYVVSGKENHCVSRKNASDFLGSLVSGHLNNECYKLSFAYPISFFFIEGYITEAMRYRKMKRHSYISSLVGIAVKSSSDGCGGLISVLCFDTPFDVALALHDMHQKVTTEDGLLRLPKIERLNLKSSMAQLYFLCSIPGIGPKKAENLYHKFHTPKNIANAKVEELKEVSGIGDKLGTEINRFFNTDYEEGK